MTLHELYDFVVANWAVISAVACFVLTNVANLLQKRNEEEKASWLRELINRLSVTTSADFPVWKLKPPLAKGPVKNGVHLNLVALVTLLAFASSCALCRDPLNHDKPICIAQRSFAACGQNALDILPGLMPYIFANNWEGLISQLETSLAPVVASCVLDVILSQLAQAKGVDSKEYQDLSGRAAKFRTKHAAAIGAK